MSWITFSAPMVLVPRENLGSWHGMHAPVDDLDDEDYDADDTIERPDGTVVVPWDEEDFDDPRSHYETVCAALEDDSVAPGPAESMAFGFEAQVGTLLLCPDGALVVGCTWGDPEEWENELVGASQGLDWEDAGDWTLEADGVALLSATDIDDADWLSSSGGEVLHFELDAGDYTVEVATWEPDDETRFELARLRIT